MRPLTIRNLFRLANGVTVLAIDRPKTATAWNGKAASIRPKAGGSQQDLQIVGESMMSGRSARTDVIAVETREAVRLTSEEAQSGQWSLSIS